MQQQNVALVKSLYAAFLGGDEALIASSLAPDIQWHSSGTDETSGTFQGVPAVLGHLLGGNPMDEFSLEVIDILASQERVAVVARSAIRRGTHRLSNEFVQLLRIADEKIVEVWDYKWDQRALAEFSALTWRAES